MTSICVNGLFLRPQRVGGTEEYAVGLLQALSEHEPQMVDRLSVLFSAAAADHHRASLGRLSILSPHAAWDRLGRPGRLAAERTWARRQARSSDIVHHLGGTAPFRGDRTVVTVYDPQFARFPEFFSPLKRRFLSASLPRAVDRADLVCVMSRFVGDELAELFQLDPSLVRVVPPALRPRTVVDGGAGLPASVRAKVRSHPFVLFPAVTWPHKNHRCVVEAMSDPQLAGVHLVLTGAAGPAEAEVQASITSSRASDRIHRLGRVSSGELAALFDAASVLAFPSRYEGFGQPVAEAMGVGLPVVASTAGSLPEVVGDAGLLVDPDDASAWATALAQVINGERSDELVSRGTSRVARWSPEAAASAQAAVYAELAS